MYPSKRKENQTWRHIPIIPALGMQRQKDQEFKVSMSYIVNSRPSWTTSNTISPKQNTNNNKKQNKKKQGDRENWRGGQAYPSTANSFDQQTLLPSTKTLFPKAGGLEELQWSNETLMETQPFLKGQTHTRGRYGLVYFQRHPTRRHTWTTCLSATETQPYIRKPHPEDKHFREIQNIPK